MSEAQQEQILRMSILVVDDLADNRDLLVALLEDLDFESIREAADGRTAIALLQEGVAIDLILLDINMPGLSGYEVLQFLKGGPRWRDIPVLMVTALDERSSAHRCIQAGAADYLTKPVDEELLRARVLACLERKYLADQERRLMRDLERERERSDQLLFNVLPARVAESLKQGMREIAEELPEVTVVFADLAGFTALAESMEPRSLVQLLNELFGRLDELCAQRGLEKIKTVGDAYVALARHPEEPAVAARQAAEFARDAIESVERAGEARNLPLVLRVGLSSGSVVGGVLGHTRFTYDLWGDVVNLAARMQETAEPGRAQLAASTHALLESQIACESRGLMEVKGKGTIPTWYLPNAGD
jgi:class 3 adenylate cyclase